MTFVKIGFPELSTGQKNPLGRGTSKIEVLATQSHKWDKDFVCFAGVENGRGNGNAPPSPPGLPK